MALSPQDPPQRRGGRRGSAVCLPCRTDASGRKPRSAHASVLSPPLARVFASASSAWKEQRLLLLFPRPPRALSRLPRKRLLQRELCNGPSESRKVGRESAEPGTCSFCSEPGGQGPRPALDSTESGLLLGQERNRAGPWAGCRGTGTPPTGQRPPWARASCLEPLPPQAPASTPPSLVDLSHRAPSGRQARCRAPWHRSGRHMWPPSTPQGRDLSRNGSGWIGSAPQRWHCVGHERGGCK